MRSRQPNDTSLAWFAATMSTRGFTAPGLPGVNTWLAVRITKTVGSMWIAYLFACIALILLPAALRSGDVIVIVSWVAQTFLQLVLLPIIIVGQNVIQAANDARAEANHETLVAVHRLTIEVHSIKEAQTAILNQLRGAPQDH